MRQNGGRDHVLTLAKKLSGTPPSAPRVCKYDRGNKDQVDPKVGI